jgi:hypothetical protein
MLKNILNEVSNFTADTDNQFALLTDEELKNIISSAAYNQDYKNRAKNELQVRINKQKLINSPGAILNPVVSSSYWWEGVNLKGYPESYPPVIYEGQVIDRIGGPSCSVYATYNGVFGCYDSQEKEHSEYMKKWFKDNAPGDDFYKNNPFYVKGKDGLPVFNYDPSRRKVPEGFHLDEYPVYLAECNNIENKYQTKISLLSKNRNSDVGRLQSQVDQYNKDLVNAESEAQRLDSYQTGTGIKNSADEYDYTGGLGATLGSVRSGGAATGNREMDSFIKFTRPSYLNLINGVNKQITDRQTQYANEVSNLNTQKNKELANKKAEYYHEDFPNGITKENYAKYLKMDARAKEKMKFIENEKRLEYAQQRQAMIGRESDATYVNPNYAGQNLDLSFNTPFGPQPEKRDIPSKIPGYEDIDWEMDMIKQNMSQQVANLNTYDTYVGEFTAIKLYFGYIPPAEPEAKKPWHGDFWEIGKIGDNFVDWLDSWDIHDILMLASLVAIAIPGLQGVGLAMRAFGIAEATAIGLGLTEGALLSAAIDLLDAGIYLSEGNTRMAGLSVLFAFIPFALESSVVKGAFKEAGQGIKDAVKFIMACPDFLVKSVTTMSMKELVEYTKLMLKPEIQAALKVIAEYGSKIQRMIQDATGKIMLVGDMKFGKKTVAEYTNAVLNFSAKGLKNVGVPLVKAGATLGGYIALGQEYNAGIDKINEIAETPKSVVERLIGKNSWEIVKNEFMSDGSMNDNNLLKAAVLAGWRPGMPVPEEYQTTTYKKSTQEKNQQKKEKTIEQLEQTFTTEDEEQIIEIIKSSEGTKKLKEKKLEETKQEVEEHTDIKTFTDEEFEKIRQKAREEERLINQQNTQSDSEIKTESSWAKFLKTNYIIE